MHEELIKIEKMVFRLLSHKVLLSPSSNDLHPSISKTYGDEINDYLSFTLQPYNLRDNFHTLNVSWPVLENENEWISRSLL